MLFRKSNKAAKDSKNPAPEATPAAPVEPGVMPDVTPSRIHHAPLYRSPQPDLYTMLLVIAFIAICIAIVFLCLEMAPYDFQFKGGPAPLGMVGHQGIRVADQVGIIGAWLTSGSIVCGSLSTFH